MLVTVEGLSTAVLVVVRICWRPCELAVFHSSLPVGVTSPLCLRAYQEFVIGRGMGETRELAGSECEGEEEEYSVAGDGVPGLVIRAPR